MVVNSPEARWLRFPLTHLTHLTGPSDIELGHLSPSQKRAYVIADNRLALDAGWDEQMLAVELAELSEDEIVFEPFGGSGTTLMAAQRTGRIGRAVEIAPEYVDVALIRFQQNFPGVPVTLAATGEPFEVVAQQRKAERRTAYSVVIATL